MKRLIFIGLAVFFILVGAGVFGREYIENIYARTQMETLPEPDSKTRLLVVAPHSDDETLGCANLISRVLAAGGKVKIVLMTNGDGHTSAVAVNYLTVKPSAEQYIQSAYRRQGETVKAMSEAGVAKSDILFLGYPDGGLYHLWGENWDEGHPYTSHFTHINHSPYANSYTPQALYCGKRVVQDLESIIREFQPSAVAFPHPNDHHPDHYATYTFVKYVVAKHHLNIVQYEYLVHRGEWPVPFGQFTRLFLVPPRTLMNTGTKWVSLPLSTQEEKRKAAMVRTYRSQMAVTSIFLKAFIRKNELFGMYNDLELPGGFGTGSQSILLISDPPFGRLRKGMDKAADIRYVKLSADGSTVHINVETEASPKEDITYHVDLVFFSGAGSVHRINLLIEKCAFLKLLSDTSENITAVEGIQIARDQKSVQISLPLERLPAFDSFLISASSSSNYNGIDRTAWRLVKKQGL